MAIVWIPFRLTTALLNSHKRLQQLITNGWAVQPTESTNFEFPTYNTTYSRRKQVCFKFPKSTCTRVREAWQVWHNHSQVFVAGWRGAGGGGVEGVWRDYLLEVVGRRW